MKRDDVLLLLIWGGACVFLNREPISCMCALQLHDYWTNHCAFVMRHVCRHYVTWFRSIARVLITRGCVIVVSVFNLFNSNRPYRLWSSFVCPICVTTTISSIQPRNLSQNSVPTFLISIILQSISRDL